MGRQHQQNQKSKIEIKIEITHSVISLVLDAVNIHHGEHYPFRYLLSFSLPSPFSLRRICEIRTASFFQVFPMHGPFSRRYVGLDIPELSAHHIPLPNLAAQAEFNSMIPYRIVQEWTQAELKQIKVQQPKKSSRVARTRLSAVLVSLRSLY
jgi:hypothetical protein